MNIGTAPEFNRLYERLGMRERGIAGDPVLGHLIHILFEVIRRIEKLEGDHPNNTHAG